ncbi:7,8-didemethyl-8-hydroxy-5-deazariboflavin synthase CofG [Vibrio pectenicida]|uniref:7,8-didemethyl-8-hydroxy-5-deazariboflavin synthase n=1 Tax=Vibrio pectenicida TaxID=62763 RepID=A0A427U870_9VIBR|nr:7,8-didemethyl-8-hydroxy-5-deazariboflavin synthase CofG [Vibrio pectenicida]RSD32899.1 7,8-didemethyl-8-hydroxy-5-deazariboflavin synthase subunit CofG [Vibrio pectenicida]
MLSKDVAMQMGDATDEPLGRLCQQAGKVRDSHWGQQVSYSRKVFIPLTNMCRDTCSYCTFVKTPQSGEAQLMSPEQVLTTVLQGQRMGCKEALFSLGEQPEKRHRLARDLLAAQGHSTTVGYLKAMSELVLEKSLLVPHINAGALSYQELAILKPVAGSMGMMLESLSPALTKKGGAHYGCPDKTPQRRIDTLEAAGELGIPFTTGLLIGIGESWQDRIESLLVIEQLHERHGHIQEVIIQNFRAKAGTAMADASEPSKIDMLRTLAVARLILSPSISLQAPPNLEQDYQDYLRAGINDWGGISPLTKDFINPERAWPQIERLAEHCQAAGYQLIERLTVYPEYQLSAQTTVESLLHSRIRSQAADDGFAMIQSHAN